MRDKANNNNGFRDQNAHRFRDPGSTFWVKISDQGPVSRRSRKLFGLISGDIILFVFSKQRRLEARNFAVIFIFIPFTTYEKTSFTE